MPYCQQEPAGESPPPQLRRDQVYISLGATERDQMGSQGRKTQAGLEKQLAAGKQEGADVPGSAKGPGRPHLPRPSPLPHVLALWTPASGPGVGCRTLPTPLPDLIPEDLGF